MKTGKYTLYFVLIVGGVYLSYISFMKYKELDDKIFSVEYELIQCRELLNDNNAAIHAGLKSNYTILSFSEIPHDGFVRLVLRLHEGMCLTCHSASLKYLVQKLLERQISLTIVGSYASTDVFERELKRIGGIEFERLNNNSLRSVVADEQNRPYLFLLSPQGQISDVFFLTKKDTLLINEYIRMVEKK